MFPYIYTYPISSVSLENFEFSENSGQSENSDEYTTYYPSGNLPKSSSKQFQLHSWALQAALGCYFLVRPWELWFMAHGGHLAFPSRGLSSGPEPIPLLQGRNHINRHSCQVSYEEMSGNLETGEQGQREDFAQVIRNRLLGWGLVLTFTETRMMTQQYHLLYVIHTNDDTILSLTESSQYARHCAKCTLHKFSQVVISTMLEVEVLSQLNVEDTAARASNSPYITGKEEIDPQGKSEAETKDQ